MPPPIRLGALQCLAALCHRHGGMLATSMADTLAVAMKFAGRWNPLSPWGSPLVMVTFSYDSELWGWPRIVPPPLIDETIYQVTLHLQHAPFSSGL